MHNKIWLVVIVVGILLAGIGLGRLFTPSLEIRVPVENSYKRIDDSLLLVIKNSEIKIETLKRKLFISDSLFKSKTIKFNNNATQIKNLNGTRLLNYLDSMFRSEGLDYLPVQ